jgi:hypothetical protein
VKLPALVWIQFQRHATQPPACSPQDRQHHIQIPFHLGYGRQPFLRGDALGLQEQLRLREQARPHRGACLPPGHIELARCAATQPQLHDLLGQTHAVLAMSARHRHQVLHGHLRTQRTAAYMLLHPARKQFH